MASPRTARVLILGADDVEDTELLYPRAFARDGNLISARTPADLGPWMRAPLAALA